MAKPKKRYITIEHSAEKVAKELGLPVDLIFKVYYSYCKEIYNRMRNVPLSSEMSKDEFDLLKTNINMINLGKFYVTWETHKQRYNRKQYVQDRKKDKIT